MDKLKQLFQDLKDKGIDITWLVFRDVLTKQPSITFTFFVITGVIAILALFDKTRVSLNLGLDFDKSKELLEIMGALYFGRRLTSGKTTVDKGDT